MLHLLECNNYSKDLLYILHSIVDEKQNSTEQLWLAHHCATLYELMQEDDEESGAIDWRAKGKYPYIRPCICLQNKKQYKLLNVSTTLTIKHYDTQQSKELYNDLQSKVWRNTLGFGKTHREYSSRTLTEDRPENQALHNYT